MRAILKVVRAILSSLARIDPHATSMFGAGQCIDEHHCGQNRQQPPQKNQLCGNSFVAAHVPRVRADCGRPLSSWIQRLVSSGRRAVNDVCQSGHLNTTRLSRGGHCLACDTVNTGLLLGLLLATFVGIIIFAELSAVSTGTLKVVVAVTGASCGNAEACSGVHVLHPDGVPVRQFV